MPADPSSWIPSALPREEAIRIAERLYAELLAAGVDVVIDDRPAHPGAKLTDVELIGIPYRLVVGPRGLADGVSSSSPSGAPARPHRFPSTRRPPRSAR